MSLIRNIATGQYHLANEEVDEALNELFGPSKEKQLEAAKRYKASAAKAKLLARSIDKNEKPMRQQLNRAAGRKHDSGLEYQRHIISGEEDDAITDGDHARVKAANKKWKTISKSAEKAKNDPRKQAKIAGTLKAAKAAHDAHKARVINKNDHEYNADVIRAKYGNKKHFKRAIGEAREIQAELFEAGYDLTVEEIMQINELFGPSKEKQIDAARKFKKADLESKLHARKAEAAGGNAASRANRKAHARADGTNYYDRKALALQVADKLADKNPKTAENMHDTIHAMQKSRRKAVADKRKQMKLAGTVEASYRTASKVQDHRDNAVTKSREAKKIMKKYGKGKHFQAALKEAQEIQAELFESGYDLTVEQVMTLMETQGPAVERAASEKGDMKGNWGSESSRSRHPGATKHVNDRMVTRIAAHVHNVSKGKTSHQIMDIGKMGEAWVKQNHPEVHKAMRGHASLGAGSTGGTSMVVHHDLGHRVARALRANHGWKDKSRRAKYGGNEHALHNESVEQIEEANGKNSSDNRERYKYHLTAMKAHDDKKFASYPKNQLKHEKGARAHAKKLTPNMSVKSGGKSIVGVNDELKSDISRKRTERAQRHADRADIATKAGDIAGAIKHIENRKKAIARLNKGSVTGESVEIEEGKQDYTRLERHALAHKAHSEKAKLAKSKGNSKEHDYHSGKAFDHSWAAMNRERDQSKITKAQKSAIEKAKAKKDERTFNAARKMSDELHKESISERASRLKSEIVSEAKGGPKPGFGTAEGKHYAVHVPGVDPHVHTQPFGRALSDLRKVKEFKSTAKTTHVGAKGKSTLAAVKAWAKENPDKHFHAHWGADSPHYKDDSVEIHWKPKT